MAKFRVYWADQPDTDRGYYADVEADHETQAAFLAAGLAQPGAAFGGITSLDAAPPPLA